MTMQHQYPTLRELRRNIFAASCVIAAVLLGAFVVMAIK